MNWKNFLNASSEKPVVPFIVGPTASGKTDLAIELANEIGGEVISADSMQIYKKMDIGTAKATLEERERVRHHLIDIINPDESYSVAQYYSDARASLFDILKRGKIPIICGGTGLYINALSKPFILDIKSHDETIRDKLSEIAKTPEGKEELYSYLKRVDSKAAEEIHPNNIKRVIRALEIYEVTGKPKSVLEAEGKEKSLEFEPLLLMKDYPREILYDRINKRVDLMIEMGLLDEVKALEKEYGREPISMQALGYKEFFPYFDGEIDLDEAVRVLKRDTRHFAKRQLTWFRKDKRIKILN